jgi:hypothetical protein
MGFKARIGTEDFRMNWQQDVYTFSTNSLSNQAMKYNWGEEVLSAKRKDEEINYIGRFHQEAFKLIQRMAMLVMIMNMIFVMTMIDGEDIFSCFVCYLTSMDEGNKTELKQSREVYLTL